MKRLVQLTGLTIVGCPIWIEVEGLDPIETQTRCLLATRTLEQIIERQFPTIQTDKVRS